MNTELAQKFDAVADKLKATAEELQGKMANGEKISQQAKETADEALTKYNELKSAIDELEQKSARRGVVSEQNYSVGEQFVKSDEYQRLKENASGKQKLYVKTITSATADANGSAGALVAEQRLAGIIAPPDRRLTVRDLLMKGTTDSNTITYMRETGFTNAAAAQASEGAKKAESTIKFDEKSVNIKTIAHYIKASRQILDDASQLQSYINGRLIFGLKLVEEGQILNGDGENGNIEGIIPQAKAFADPASMKNYTIIDQLRLAQLQAVLAEYPASGQVLNPIDWAQIELSKDNEARYIIGNPQSTIAPTLWGVPVVTTQAMGVGKFLVGAFSLGAQIFDRQQAAVEVGFENDDFTKNIVTILCEERLALAVYRPEAFIYGTLAAK